MVSVQLAFRVLDRNSVWATCAKRSATDGT